MVIMKQEGLMSHWTQNLFMLVAIVVGIALAVVIGVTSCGPPPIEFQGPTPHLAPWIEKPSDATIHFGLCSSSLPNGGRCIWFRHTRPGQDSYYVRSFYNPAGGHCDFYPQYGDVYIGDEWEGSPAYLRVFAAPAPC